MSDDDDDLTDVREYEKGFRERQMHRNMFRLPFSSYVHGIFLYFRYGLML